MQVFRQLRAIQDMYLHGEEAYGGLRVASHLKRGEVLPISVGGKNIGATEMPTDQIFIYSKGLQEICSVQPHAGQLGQVN